MHQQTAAGGARCRVQGAPVLGSQDPQGVLAGGSLLSQAGQLCAQVSVGLVQLCVAGMVALQLLVHVLQFRDNHDLAQ